MSPRRKIPAAIDHGDFGVTEVAEFIAERWASLPRPLLPTVRATFPEKPLVTIVAAIREAHRRRP